MTKRSLRHSTRYVKAIPFAIAVLAIAYVSGAMLRAAWTPDMLTGALRTCTAAAFLALALLLIREAGVRWTRWLRQQDTEDAIRCALPSCDQVLRRPFIQEQGFGRICMDCFKRIERAAESDELPTNARRVGA